MKVEINTYEKKVIVVANNQATTVVTIDKWIKALKVAREWLRKELEDGVLK